MKNYFKLSLVVMAVLLVQFTIGAGNIIQDSQEITPDAEIQAQIELIVSVADINKETFEKEISKLRIMDESLDHLIQQLIYFQLHKIRMHRAKEITYRDMEQAIIPAESISCILVGIRDRVPLRLTSDSAQSIINAVVPYLGTKDPDFLELLHTQLLRVDALRGDDELDYSHYESFINERKQNPPLPLIQYMYEKAPGEALLVLTRIYVENPKAREPIIQAQQAVSADIKNRGYDVDRSRVVSILDKLSRDRRWWVRLYVAEIMNSRHQPAAYYKNDAPEVFKRLQRDRSFVVRSVFKRPKK